LFGLLAALALSAFSSCGREHPAGSTAPSAVTGHARPGAVEADAATPAHPAAGQTVYVPVYSQIPIGDRGNLFDLAVTLTVRNTDRGRAIVISAVRYYDRDGRLVRDHVKAPLRVAPMASADFFVRERDASGGSSASFLVEWVADARVSNPVVQAVMIGSAGNQGISFLSEGRVLEERTP
jgi:hypothetical protein